MEAGINAVRRVAAKEILQLRFPLFVALLLGWFGFSPPWLVAAPSHKKNPLRSRCAPSTLLSIGFHASERMNLSALMGTQ